MRNTSCKKVEFCSAKVRGDASGACKVFLSKKVERKNPISKNIVVTWGRTVAWQLHRHQTQRKVSEDTQGRRSLEFVWYRTCEKNFVCWRRFEGEGKVGVRSNSLDEKSGGQTRFIQDQGLINKINPYSRRILNFVMDLAQTQVNIFRDKMHIPT